MRVYTTFRVLAFCLAVFLVVGSVAVAGPQGGNPTPTRDIPVAVLVRTGIGNDGIPGDHRRSIPCTDSTGPTAKFSAGASVSSARATEDVTTCTALLRACLLAKGPDFICVKEFLDCVGLSSGSSALGAKRVQPEFQDGLPVLADVPGRNWPNPLG